MFLKNPVRENKIFSHRLVTAWVIVFVTLVGIMTRLFFLQVVDYEIYKTRSDENRIKVIPLPPTRGLIYDRNGVLLAGNQVSYSLEVMPAVVNDMEALLAKIGEMIDLSEHDLAVFRKKLKQTRRYNSVPLRFNLDESEVARFSVQSHNFQGIVIKSNFSRYYPLGETGVHTIGYVGRINQRELKQIDQANYMGTHYIGKTGLEKFYEKELHGKTGFQYVETNVQGEIVHVLERTPSIPGVNLFLNLDIDLQRYIERLVARYRAAVVAIEPSSGGVLALVSMPYYDPNLFVKGIDVKSYRKLRDSYRRPLINRAIRGQYPPGSTIKAFVGLAGLEYGIRTPYSRTWCRGWYSLKGQNHRYRDWKKSGHGSMNLYTAIEQSCDVYFYDLAHDLGIDRLHAFMTRFGFGKKTGIDVSGELSGLMPSREWKKRALNKRWYPGETVIAGIGQGFMLTTPLQLATATATLSNRGRFKQPRVVFATEDARRNEMTVIQPSKHEDVVLKKAAFWSAAINGMKAVVHGRRGTAHKIGLKSRYRFAGKTGTAQVITIKQTESYDERRLAKRFHDHSLFVAFAPLRNPRIALAVIVENGGSGSETAAPLAKKIMDYYLLNQW
jgi:penicillin-binding protein 2